MSKKYSELANFLEKKMRMSHIYQPVMLSELLANQGKSKIINIAKALLFRDESQIEYYERITKNMVGKVLRKRKIVKRVGEDFELIGYSELDEKEIKVLIELCRIKINQFIDKRKNIWTHRKKSSGYVPGSLRYEILKQAKFRCTLCGISAEVKALDVDHIVPRNCGGSDESSNLQALCCSCNAMKRDRDDEDLRNVSKSYQHREENCLFCNIGKKRIFFENKLCYSVEDQYPVTSHHSLVIPKRHVSGYFDLYLPERNAAHELLNRIQDNIKKEDKTVEGYNIGINSGEVSGQTILHCHIHLIPRRIGDTQDPRGGVRGVIPGRQSY